MISLYTNKTEYIADIADELRLFLAKEEITEAENAAADVCVTLEGSGTERHARAQVNTEKGMAVYEWDCVIPQGADALEIKRREKRAVKIAAFRAMANVYGVMPPWGSLTGIRPTRLLRELRMRHGEAEAISLPWQRQ